MIQLILLLFGLASTSNPRNTATITNNQYQITGSIQQGSQDTGGETTQLPPKK